MADKFTIVLDAGHGGTNLAGGSTPNNATGANGLLEKDLTLKIARIAASMLGTNGFETLLTRADDRNLSLVERARKSRESGADAFVSIHFNGHPDKSVDGTEVFISNGAGEREAALAGELLKNISRAASIAPRGIRKTDFTILKGDHHVAKTAACLVEMAYLTNPAQAQKLLLPDYLERLAGALAQSVAAYAQQFSYAKPFAEEGGEKLIAEAEKEHADPKNFPIDLPEPGKGADVFKIAVPKGLKFSRWEVEVTALSAGAGYKIAEAPKAGAEGSSKIVVEWWHLPYGKIDYKLKAYASPDGKSAASEKIVFDSPGWMEKAKDQLKQGLPMSLAVKGEKAKQIYEAIQKHQAGNQSKQAGGISIAMEPITITVVVLVGIVIFGILVALGLLTLGAIIKMALDKGYNVKDTKYKAGVGEGQLRQDHEIAFNITKPEKTAPPQSLSFGLSEDFDAGYFEPLEYDDDYRFEALDSKPDKDPVAANFKGKLLNYKAMPSDRKKTGENLFLCWTEIPKADSEIDVVIHFHGWNISNEKDFFDFVIDKSGLDLQKRVRPTLCIVPFGTRGTTLSDGRIPYSFNYFNDPDNLQKLIDFSLGEIAKPRIFTRKRLILTAHSGGFEIVAGILDRKLAGTLRLGKDAEKNDKGRGIDEVHLFDATYGGTQSFLNWADVKIRDDLKLLAEIRDKKRPLTDLSEKGGALRVLYLPCSHNKKTDTCSKSGTAAVAQKIESKLADLTAPNPGLKLCFRVDAVDIEHLFIPKAFGGRLLEDARADLTRFQPDKSMPANNCRRQEPAKCANTPKAESKSLSFDYEEPDYFAAGETDYPNY